MNIKLKNAIISVQDKTGIETLVLGLKKYNINIYATDGTKKFLEEKGIEVNTISDITGNNQILDGRVKTIDFKLFAGILADSNNIKHITELEKLKIPKIDLIVVNLYDFLGALQRGKSQDELIEQIDIGGVSLLRAASKNYKSCVCIPAIKHYEELLEHINANNGNISIEFSKTLSIQAFKITCEYDYIIYLGLTNLPEIPNFIPLYRSSELKLRYGENPHQKASILKTSYPTENSIMNNIISGAKEVSYNNILDSNTAFEIVQDFNEPTATVIKHQSPACVMSHSDKLYVCENIFKLDYESSFGGILGLNFNIGIEEAETIVKSAPFIHCIVSPNITKDAIEYIKTQPKWGKNIHLFQYKKSHTPSILSAYNTLDIKSIPGAILMQQRDFYSNDITYEIMSGQVDNHIIEDLLFAFKVAKFVKSNSIVIVKDKQTIGIGSGQTSRIGAVKNAISKVPNIPEEACLGSDGFFPFPDSLEYASKQGIKNFIAPRGSVKDYDVVEFAKNNHLTLLFTNVRHFKH